MNSLAELTLGPLQLGLLLAAGVVAGFVNTLAGGGSLLTIPALIFLGMPSPIANGTNRVAILLQNMMSTWRFQRRGTLVVREAVLAAVPAGAGAVAGALVAVELPEEVFDVALGVVLILVMITMFLPRRSATESARAMPAWLRVLVFFGIGIYGGFIQAGVGFLLISAITVAFGHDLVGTNAIKVAIVMALTAVALVIFALHGAVIWAAGLILAVGTVAGAWIGVRFAVKRGAKAIRWVVVAAAMASALRLFGVF